MVLLTLSLKGLRFFPPCAEEQPARTPDPVPGAATAPGSRGPWGRPALLWRRGWSRLGKGPRKEDEPGLGLGLVDHLLFSFWRSLAASSFGHLMKTSLSSEVYTHARVILIWTQVSL